MTTEPTTAPAATSPPAAAAPAKKAASKRRRTAKKAAAGKKATGPQVDVKLRTSSWRASNGDIISVDSATADDLVRAGLAARA